MEITDKKLRVWAHRRIGRCRVYSADSLLWRHNWRFFPITGISCTVNIWKISGKELEMHISDVGMTGNLLRWSSTYECSDKHFLYIFSSPVFKILAVFMLEISINNCSRQLYLVFSLSTNRWYFLPDHVISNCVTRSSTSRLYAIKRLVHNLSFTLHVTLPLPVPSPLTLRARATAPAR